jgi:hypothetical protein
LSCSTITQSNILQGIQIHMRDEICLPDS